MTIVHCCICTAELSETRARRQTSVCSEKCKNKLDSLRAEQRANRKCPHCLHPSTPELRRKFRLFAKQIGDVKTDEPVRRDTTWPPKNELRVALKRALDFLKVERVRRLGLVTDSSVMLPIGSVEALHHLDMQIAEFERLLDTKEPESVRLAPSGIAAQENHHEFVG